MPTAWPWKWRTRSTRRNTGLVPFDWKGSILYVFFSEFTPGIYVYAESNTQTRRQKLRKQGLLITGLTTAFLAVDVARFQKTFPAIGWFLTADDSRRINVVFVRALKLVWRHLCQLLLMLLKKVVRIKLYKASLDVTQCWLPPVRNSFVRNLREAITLRCPQFEPSYIE